jgi:DNA (cytosine-5)-methyltransferase 1
MTFLPATNTNPYDYEAKGRTDHAAGTKNEKLYGSSEDHGAAYRRGWQQARREAPEVGAAPALAPPPQGGEDALRVHGGDPEVGGTRLPEGSPDAAAGSDPGPLTRKPPYRVPLMAEIAALPWNGFTAVSTFSGCGGSSLGYKLAGFRVAWASEFIPAAQETYRANHPATILDCRDIREVKAEDILAATGLAVGEIDLFDGSPPCASFSTAGIREDGWGKVKKYSDTEQRTDDLFFEFARLIKGTQPKVFVAENVAGLTVGVAKEMLGEGQLDAFETQEDTILHTLMDCGYRVGFHVLNASELGVPQARRRVIFVGIRKDLAAALNLEPSWPRALPYAYTIREALAAAIPAEHDVAGVSIERYAIGAEWEKLKPGEQSEKYFSLVRTHPDEVCPTICASHGSGSIASITHFAEKRKFSIGELRRLSGFPDDFKLTGTYEQQWERLGRAVPPVMMAAVASTVRDELLAKIRAHIPAPVVPPKPLIEPVTSEDVKLAIGEVVPPTPAAIPAGQLELF